MTKALWDFCGNCVIGTNVTSPEDTTVYIWLLHSHPTAMLSELQRGSCVTAIYAMGCLLKALYTQVPSCSLQNTAAITSVGKLFDVGVADTVKVFCCR